MNPENQGSSASVKPKKKLIDKSLFTLEDDFGKLNLFKLAIPQFLDLFLISFLSVISTIVINQISTTSAVAVDGAGKVLGVVSTISTIVNTGSSIMLSIYMGKNDTDSVKKLCYINFALTSIICLSLNFILLVFAEPIYRMMNLSGDKLAEAVKYSQIRCMFMVFPQLAACMNTIMRCYGDSKPTFYSGIASAVVSTVLSTIAITDISPFSDPIVGVSFAAIASGLVQFIISLIFFLYKKIKITPKFSSKLIKQLFKVGLPGGVSALSYSLSQLITTSFVLQLSDIQQNAKIYVTSLAFLTYQFGYSIGNADAIMVGRHCGNGQVEKADKMHKQNILIGLFFGVSLSLLFLASHRLLFRIYTSDNKTLNLIFKILLVDLFVETGRALNHLGEFSLNGVGDVYATTVISMTSCWSVSVLFAYVLGIVCNFGVIGIWAAFALDEITRGLLYLFRWRSGKWKKKFIENKI